MADGNIKILEHENCMLADSLNYFFLALMNILDPNELFCSKKKIAEKQN